MKTDSLKKVKKVLKSGVFISAAVWLSVLPSCKSDDKDKGREKVEMVLAAPSTVIVSVGGSKEVTVTVIPQGANQKVLWSVADPEIAEVIDGFNTVIKGKKKGNTTVTVASDEDNTKKAEISVTVTEDIPVEEIKFEVTEIWLEPEQVYFMDVTILPTNATNQGITWESSDNGVATVNTHGDITAIDVGEAFITASSDENPEINATVKVNVGVPNPADIILNAATGLWEFSDPDDIGKATIGTDLVPMVGADGITPLANGSVRVGTDSYFICTHGVPPDNEEFGVVTKYTIMFDFKIPKLGEWYAFYYARPAKSIPGGSANPGWAASNLYPAFYISPAYNCFVTGTSVSWYTLQPDVWYRLVLVWDRNIGFNTLFVDGYRRWNELDDWGDIKSLEPEIELFMDGYYAGYAYEMEISTVAIWDHILADEEIETLGGVR